MENMLGERLTKLEADLRHFLAKGSVIGLFKMYRKVCREMTLAIKRVSLFGKDKKVVQIVSQCVASINTLVNATQYMKNGHKLPLFSYIIKSFQKEFNRKTESNEAQTLRRTLQNQKQPFYQSLNFKAITPRQRNFLTKDQINNDISDLLNNQIKIHNPECVCCSEIFVRNLEITNANPTFPVVIALSQKQSDQINLEKYACAVANQGGGVIVVGAERRGDSIWPVGIKFKKYFDIEEKEKQIKENIKSIRPDVVVYVQPVVVHTNFIESNEADDETNRFCFRVCIFPLDLKKKYYIEIYNKGYHNLYQIFELDANHRPYKVLNQSTGNESHQGFYSLAMDWYNENKNLQKVISKRTSSHQYVQCYKPLMQYSKAFQKASELHAANSNDLKKEETEMKGPDFNYVYNDEPKFKYTNTSLLAVGSKKKDRFIKDLRLFMKTKKMLFQLEKPFENSFKDGSRSIWMLSHLDKHDVIKSCIKDCDNTGSITMIPVYKTLQIDRSRLSVDYELEIQHRFKQRYPEGYRIDQLQIEDENGLIKHPVLLSFDSFTQAIYGYMIFELLQMRPYFVKENTTYKKKPKIKSE